MSVLKCTCKGLEVFSKHLEKALFMLPGQLGTCGIFYLHVHILLSLDPTTNSKTINSNFKTKCGHLDQVLPVLFVWFFAGIRENSEFGIGCMSKMVNGENYMLSVLYISHFH